MPLPTFQRSVLTAIAASCLGAAEPEWGGGGDTIVLTWGLELRGTVVGQRDGDTLIDVGPTVITIETARILRIVPGGSRLRADEPRPQPMAAQSRRAPFASAPTPTVGADGFVRTRCALFIGALMGAVDGDGRIADAPGGPVRTLKTSFGAGGPLAGVEIAAWWQAGGRSIAPCLGARVDLGASSGAAGLTTVSAEAVAGASWYAGGARWDLLAGAGPAGARLSRQFHLNDFSGAPLDAVSVEDDLSGWSAGVGLDAVWQLGRWEVGLGCAARHQRLAGSSSWSLAGMPAEEDLDATLTGVMGTCSIGISW